MDIPDIQLVVQYKVSNDVPATQEAPEAEWLNKHRLDYQKGEKHATNSQKKCYVARVRDAKER